MSFQTKGKDIWKIVFVLECIIAICRLIIKDLEA